MKIINVTREHINNGVRGSGKMCALALSIQEQTDMKEAWVGPFSGVWPSLGAYTGGRGIPLPVEARKFICDFDDGKPVQPFSFELDV
jgi:hypothetical protein